MTTRQEVLKSQRFRKKAGLPYVLPTICFCAGRDESEIGKKERHDCTVIAIANACDVHYDKAWEILNLAGRENRKGFGISLFLETSHFHPLYKGTNPLNISAEKVEFRQKWYEPGPKLTLKKFLKNHRKGTYIVTTHNHATVVKDGIYYDRGTNGPRQWVRSAYKIEKRG